MLKPFLSLQRAFVYRPVPDEIYGPSAALDISDSLRIIVMGRHYSGAGALAHPAIPT
ncbi:MAG TPA: hypothetical protein VEI98_03425 [Xanthobacteraceae bacterium]|nr:hypothetical protein [Xanthobacteraceae bacterium]